MEFPCTGCGACCMAVGAVIENIDKYSGPQREELEKFPYKAKKDGSCEKLIDGSCSVYNDRPTICNIEEMFEKHFASFETKEEYFSKQVKGCSSLIKLFKLDKNLIPVWHQQ